MSASYGSAFCTRPCVAVASLTDPFIWDRSRKLRYTELQRYLEKCSLCGWYRTTGPIKGLIQQTAAQPRNAVKLVTLLLVASLPPNTAIMASFTRLKTHYAGSTRNVRHQFIWVARGTFFCTQWIAPVLRESLFPCWYVVYLSAGTWDGSKLALFRPHPQYPSQTKQKKKPPTLWHVLNVFVYHLHSLTGKMTLQ